MTLRQKGILIGLDTAAIILSIIEMIFSLLIITYTTNQNIKSAFIVIGIISAISLYRSIKCILNGEK